MPFNLGIGLGLSRRGVGAPVTVPTAVTAPWGAKTLAGAGGFRPKDSNGDPVNLTSYDSLVSGSLGSYTPTITAGGALAFTGGGAGGPAGAVLRCSHAGGQIDITIDALAPNTYSASTRSEANTAYGSAVLGDTIWITNNNENPTAVRSTFSRSTSPSGTWTGTSRDLLPTANWVVIEPAPNAKVVFGCIELANNGGSNPMYTRLNNIDVVSPYNGDTNGNGTGVSINVTGQISVQSTNSFVAITNCRTTMVTPITPSNTGGFKAINCFVPDVWIQGNTVDGAKFGYQGDCRRSIIKGNTFKRVQADAIYLRRVEDGLLEGNITTDKIYGYTENTILGITRGATTVLTIADTSAVAINEPCLFVGVSGSLGDLINGRFQNVTAKTASTITLQINTSAMPDWDGVSGIVQTAFGFHGDALQIADDAGADGLQDDFTIRGNIFQRGNPTGLWPGGQLIVGNASGTERARNNWLIEGNIYHDAFQNAPLLTNLVNATVRSNTFVRAIGFDGSNGGSIPGPVFSGTFSSGNILLDNIANNYTLGSGVATDTNNYVLTLTNNDASPADPATIAAYEAAFADPPLVPNTTYDAKVALATRTDAGGAFNGYTIFPGATPYFDFDTMTYDDPRAATVPDAMDAPTSAALSRSTALTITKAADPADGGSAITSYDLRHSPDGSTWTEVIGFTSPYELTGLTPGQNYHIQTRAVNAVGAGAWSASVQEKTSLVDFTASPLAAAGVSASAITGGWAVTISGTGSRPLAWNIDGILSVSANATFTFTIEPSSVADTFSARATNGAGLTGIRGMNVTLTGLSAGVASDQTCALTSVSADTDYIGVFHTSTVAKTFNITNLKLVTP